MKGLVSSAATGLVTTLADHSLPQASGYAIIATGQMVGDGEKIARKSGVVARGGQWFSTGGVCCKDVDAWESNQEMSFKEVIYGNTQKQKVVREVTKAEGALPKEVREIVFSPPRGWVPLNLHQLWEYRELLYFLIWQDLKVRYKQTVLGVVWTVLQPFLTMIVFSIFFGLLGRTASGGLPYPVFFYAALLPWSYFSSSLIRSSNSLIGNASLLSKVYFPRLILPLSSVLGGLVDFVFAFVVLLGLMFFYRLRPTTAVLWLPAFLLLALVTALGAGLWLSALNVRYRDFRYIVPFMNQTWFFITPIIYSSTIVPQPWRTLYGLNPMVGVVEGFRRVLLGTKTTLGPMVWVSALVAVALLVSGAYYFRRMEQTFADVV